MKYKYQGGKTTGQGVGGVRVRANLAANDEGEGNTSEHETSSDGARKKLSSINEVRNVNRRREEESKMS